MSTVIVPLLPLAGLGVYLFVGWKFARYRLPVIWQKARKAWSTSEYVKPSVRAQFIGTWIAWPYMLTYIVMERVWNKMMAGIDGVVSSGDPQVHINRLEASIKQLEAWHKKWELDNAGTKDSGTRN